MKPLVIEGRVPIYIYAYNLEPEVLNQIERIKDLPFFRDKIVIMPDCHAGKGCVIGFTGYFDEVVIPNIVGVDIGCGVYTYPLNLKVNPKNPQEDIDFRALDKFIKKRIPLGLKSRNLSDAKNLPLSKKDQELLKEIRKVLIGTYKIPELQDPILQVGTLGSGNHFIELDIDNEGQVYLTVHSGSRNLGLKVCNYFQRKAWDYVLMKGEKLSKSKGNFTPPDKRINQLGAEILRLWVSGEDYRDDIRVSDEIIKSFTIAYRKIRNTIRFMFGFINDFNPENPGSRRRVSG